MKNTLFLLFCATALMTSCHDDFLERNPYGSIDENTFYTQAEHANLAAIACYNKLLSLNNHWAKAQLELGMTGDFSSGGFKDAKSFYNGTFTPNESNVIAGIWEKSYQGIAVCNLNIQHVENMSSDIIENDIKDRYLAEMRFIRAFWYYRLIQFYGKVPLRTTSVIDPNDDTQVKLGVSPKQDIIDQLIVPDLEFAANYLPEQWDDVYAKRATKGAAYAYLTDVYVYSKQWDKAISSGKEIESLGYTLIQNPGDVLRIEQEGSSELIFSVAFGQGMESEREYYFGTKENLGGTLGRIMRGDTYSGDYFYPSNDFVDFFETIDGKKINESSLYDPSKKWKNRDPRFDATFFTIQDKLVTTTGVELIWDSSWLVNTVTGFDIQKRGVWYGDNTWHRRADIHFMRLPRVFLLMAEAYANRSEFANAANYIEKVRERARNYALKNKSKYIPVGLSETQVLPKKQISSLSSAIEAINYEARVEFFAEDAIRYFDLKRWNMLQVEWPRVGGFKWDGKFYNLPIPSSELNNNEKIEQNHPNWGV